MSHLVPLKQRPITAVRKRGELLIPKRFKYPGVQFPMLLTVGSAAGVAGYAEGLYGDLTPVDPVNGLKTFHAVQATQELILGPLSAAEYPGTVYVEIPAIGMAPTEMLWDGFEYTEDSLAYYDLLLPLVAQTIPITAWIVT